MYGPKAGYDTIQESDEIRVAAAGPAVVVEHMNSRADSSLPEVKRPHVHVTRWLISNVAASI